jgi:CubicO group peptidase (beta-lactamase class C family)
MFSKIHFRLLLPLVFAISIFTVSLPQAGYAQVGAKVGAVDLSPALKTIEDKTEVRRKELGIPGMALVIVKDDQIIYMKGLGFRDFEKQIPVTPDTQFGIGSATKAFTALSLLMLQDEGKINLGDNPKKYLPYFKINDPDTDKNITVRDILSHASGLNRTDLAMITGKLNREELIRVAGEAKPVAKLRERFLYQNIMFAAAGEIIGHVQKMRWETFVPERIFKPLGMSNSTASLAEMEKAKNYSNGYDYNFDTKETRKLQPRDITEAAPAGAINSSARDMAQWLRFVLNGGAVNGRRIISEKSFEEWTKPQMKIAGKTSYGLGWFIQDWNGLKVLQHGGNIDGYNSMVALIPEKKLGFVMLTNVSASSLGEELMPIVWKNILGPVEASNTAIGTAVGNLAKETGKYHFEEAGFDAEIRLDKGQLYATVPGQPTYTLENVGGRRYRLKEADGFFITFKDDSLYLEQPQGNYTLPKIKAAVGGMSERGASARDLVGKYESAARKGVIVEVRESVGKVTLNIEGQPPYELTAKDDDSFNLSPLPATYSLMPRRDPAGKITAIAISQPEGEFVFNLVSGGDSARAKLPSADEVMAKAVDALGGAAIRKFTSRVTKFDLDFENQGVKGSGTAYAKAPNKSATEAVLTALGKNIATAHDYFDGVRGGQIVSFAAPDFYTGKRLEDAKITSDFYGLANWSAGVKTSEITRTEKVGDEEAFVVALHYEKASDVTWYISTKTYLPLKRNSLDVSSTSSQAIPVSEAYADYRSVDGVMIPFKTIAINPAMGTVVTYIRDVKNNVEIPDSRFTERGK